MRQDVDGKRCPMAWLGEEFDFCQEQRCAWWVEGKGCAVAVLAAR